MHHFAPGQNHPNHPPPPTFRAVRPPVPPTPFAAEATTMIHMAGGAILYLTHNL